MSDFDEPDEQEVDSYYKKVKADAESGGYHLNSDEEFTKELLKSILINKKRYGYGACPCRLASGTRGRGSGSDLSHVTTGILTWLITMPVTVVLYVSGKILSGERELQSIPERRPTAEERKKIQASKSETVKNLSKPVWRCNVCGYLCARDAPP